MATYTTDWFEYDAEQERQELVRIREQAREFLASVDAVKLFCQYNPNA